jgi:predicted nucleic acid-binding protein
LPGRRRPAGLGHPVDRQPLEQGREPAVGLGPRDPDLTHPVVGARRPRHIGFEDRLKLTGVEMPPPPRLAVVARAGPAAVRAGQPRAVPPAQLDEHRPAGRGPAYACLALAESNAVRLYISPAILAEVRDVLGRPDITAKFPSLTPERVDLFVQKLAALAVVVDDPADANFPLADADDLPYLNLAVAANVGYIVSRDKGLRDLMGNPGFFKRFPHLRVVDPFGFLQSARQAA